MVIKVYGLVGSNATFRVIAALVEKDLDFELVPTQIFDVKEQKTPQFLARNPFGQIPVLEDGDFTLFVWNEVESQKFDPISAKLYQELVIKPMRGQTADEAIVSEFEPKLADVLDVYESRLTTNKYLGGANFTLVDLNHLPDIHYLIVARSRGVCALAFQRVVSVLFHCSVLMATKRKPSKRQVRVPLKFSDHVVQNLSQKRVDDGSDGVGDEIRAGCGSENGDFGDKDVVTDKGVFGNADNYFEAVTPNVSDTQSSGNIDKNVFVNNPEKVNEVNNMHTDVTSDNTQVNKVNNDLTSKGSVRWRLTLCGYFVGCKMSTNELNYNLRRMWSKYGLLDVKAHTNGNWFFKFRSEAGLNEVLEKGPWIVNNRSMFVQKWDPIIGMDKKEMSTIPIWAKLTNVPLEAWSNEGISALASSLDKNVIRKRRENVKPIETDAEGFVEVNYKKNAGQKRTDDVVNSSKNDFNGMRKNGGLWRKKTGNNGKQSMQDPNKESNTVQNKTWPLQKEDFNAMKKTANKYAILGEMDEDERNELRILKDRMIVDQYLNKKLQPNIQETKDCTKDMIHYFKEKWEDDRQKEKSSSEENLEDVMKNADQTDLNCQNGCRILIGWDKDLVNVMVLHCSKQAVLCQIEVLNSNIKCFCSFVYAANTGLERKILWRDLKAVKTIIMISMDASWTVLMKSRRQRNRVTSICNEEGMRFEGTKVADEFVKHFQPSVTPPDGAWTEHVSGGVT
ncbi:glutathione S-transferase-like protein [Tanacetum coccineum]